MRRAIARFVAVTAGVAAFLAPATIAYSAWSTTAQATLQVTVPAADPTPVLLSCTSDKTAKSATLRWTALQGFTYHLVDKDTGFVLPGTLTSGTADIRDSALPNGMVNLKVVVRATAPGGATTTSTGFFDIQLAAGTCVVVR